MKDELALAAAGWPDPGRAHSQEHLSEHLRTLRPDLPPEEIASRADFLWKIGQEIGEEDYLFIPLEDKPGGMLGEITGPRRLATDAEGVSHVWPMRWHVPYIPFDAIPGIQFYREQEACSEIAEPALSSITRHIPSLRRTGPGVFQWVSAILLLLELIYFWPH